MLVLLLPTSSMVMVAGLTGIAGTENIITGTAATFTNVVKVGTAITLDTTSGIITAVNGFVGDLTGTASLASLANLTGTPDITVRNITGVAATFTGVLTYEDVTSVDSVGIVTARGGVELGAAGVGGTFSATGFGSLEGGLNVAGVVTATSYQGDGSTDWSFCWYFYCCCYSCWYCNHTGLEFSTGS